MSKITDFVLFIFGVAWIGIAGFLVYLFMPVYLSDITLIPASNPNVQIHVASAEYNRLFSTLTYTSEGNTITVDTRQFRMLVKEN